MTRGRMSHVEGVIYTQFEPRTRTVNSVPAIPLGFCLLPRPTRNAPPLTRLKSASTEDGAGQPGHNLRLTFHLMLICVFLSLTRPHARARGAWPWAEMLRLDERRAPYARRIGRVLVSLLICAVGCAVESFHAFDPIK